MLTHTYTHTHVHSYTHAHAHTPPTCTNRHKPTTHFKTLQHTATHLQHTTTRVQHTGTNRRKLTTHSQHIATHVQHTVTHLQHTRTNRRKLTSSLDSLAHVLIRSCIDASVYMPSTFGGTAGTRRGIATASANEDDVAVIEMQVCSVPLCFVTRVVFIDVC